MLEHKYFLYFEDNIYAVLAVNISRFIQFIDAQNAVIQKIELYK